MEKSKYHPKDDGKTHINIYSKGKTVLGRSLSNFCFRRFSHPVYGQFCSMEGFYYYISTGCKVESLRRLTGAGAKREGTRHPKVKVKDFEKIMREGIQACFMNDDRIRDMVISQTIENNNQVLPFVHYYVVGDAAVFPKGNDWLCDEWDKVRKYILEQAGAEITETEAGLQAVFSEY